MRDSTRRLKDMISSLRRVDRLITREKDPGRLIREACRLLSAMEGYSYSWIVLLDGSGTLIDSAESGIGDDFSRLLEMVASGDLPSCVSRALESRELVVNLTDEPYCGSCGLKVDDYSCMESFIVSLEHEDRVFGVMSGGFPSGEDDDGTRMKLFRDIAQDIAYALHVSRVEGERERSIESLRESEALLNAFLDHFPGPAFIRDRESRYLHVNRYFRERFGPAEKWIGKTPSQLFSDDFARRMLREDERALEKGYHVYEKRLSLKGEGPIFEIHTFRIDRRDKPPLIGGIAVEITEWYRAKEALRASEERYRTVFQNTGSATALIDSDMTIMMINRGFEKLSGYTSEEVCGRMKWTEFVSPGDLDMMMGYHRDRRSGGTDVPREYEFRIIDRQGVTRDVHMQVDMIPGTEMSVCSVLDISELKSAQSRLHDSIRKMESLLKTMPDMMFVLSRNGEYEDYWVNDDSALAIPPDRILGSSISELALSGDKLDEVLDRIALTLDTGKIHSVEYELDMGAARRYFEARLSPYFDHSVIAVVRDITGRREEERKRLELEARIQHTQKLESLGVLAGGIAHDFNNILMTILGNADLALMSLPDSSPARSFLGEVVSAASTASDLARQMLAYSGRSDFEIRPLDLNEIVRDMTHMLEVSISKKVVLKLRLAEELPVVMADSAQIGQIIMNLITNASEAVGNKSGYISLTTGAMYCDSEYLSTTEFTGELSDDLYVYLEVADTGCGMDETVRSQVFEPFFTTKYTGRGLGLSSVLGIVRGHGGAVKVYSEPGQGTTFKVLLPACPDGGPLQGTPSQDHFGEGWKGSGLVLFADDEDTVLAVGRRMLEHMGFGVLTAEDGREALAVFRKRRDDLVLVILDMTMPHLGGDEVYREIRRMDCDIPVIVSSGFSRKDVMHRFAGKRIDGFIQKPYRAEDLSKVIRNVLDPEPEQGSE